MTTLFLVRHGETVDNARQVMQGQTQGQLNANGIAQAEHLRDQLAHEPLDAILSSDLQRAIDTANIIAQPHLVNGKSIVTATTPLLRERDWGSFTGRYIPDLKGLPWPADVEPKSHLLCRAQQFLDFIRNHYPDRRVLAVGHGIVNKAIQAVYHHCDMSQVERMQNAEVRILQL